MRKVSTYYRELDNRIHKIYLVHTGVSSCQLVYRLGGEDSLDIYRSRVMGITSFSRLLSRGGVSILSSGDSQVRLRISVVGGRRELSLVDGGEVHEILRIEVL